MKWYCNSDRQGRRHRGGLCYSPSPHPFPPPFFCAVKRKKGNKEKKERISKQKLLKGCRQGQNITVLAILESLEFGNFSCRPTMVADNTFQCRMTLKSILLTWGCSFIAFHYFDWNILTFCTNFKRPSALKEHTLWCKSGIYCWNLSEKVYLMYGNSFPILLLWNLKYISLYFTHNSVKSSCQ